MRLCDIKKVSDIKKLNEVYWIRFPIHLSKGTDDKKVSILQLNNENIIYGCSHYMLYEDEYIFTTLNEAINYCKENNFRYIIIDNYQYKNNGEC